MITRFGPFVFASSVLTPLGFRERALLLVGFAAGFRRGELVDLNVADFGFKLDGLVVSLSHSKTNPESEGRKVGAPYGYYPGEKRIVERMPALRNEGLGFDRIADALDREGIQ